MSRSFLFISTLFILSGTLAACVEETPPPVAPTPRVAQVPPQPVSCGPIGTYRLDGPAGATNVEVSEGDVKGTFVVRYQGATSFVGTGAMANSELRVNPSTGGNPFSCRMSDDCNSIVCNGIPGMAPIVIPRMR